MAILLHVKTAKKININGKLNIFKTNIDGKSAVNYYLPNGLYRNLYFVTYKQMFEENVLLNEEEIFNNLVNLKTCYKGLICEIDNQIAELKHEFNNYCKIDQNVIQYITEEEKSYQINNLKQRLNDTLIKHEFGFVKDGIYGEYDPQGVISDCQLLVDLLGKPDYTLCLINSSNSTMIKGKKLAKLLKFNVDEKNNYATISGSVELYNEAVEILKMISRIVTTKSNSRDNMLDANFSANLYNKKFKQYMLKTANMLLDFG